MPKNRSMNDSGNEDSAERVLDSVTIESTEGRLTTLDEALPYRTSGFHWQFVTSSPLRVKESHGDTAVGAIDGEIMTRGIIKEISFDSRGFDDSQGESSQSASSQKTPELAEVFVSPPHGGQTNPTHWL